MPQSVAFCSANDRPVPVTLRATRQPPAADPQPLVCLDYGRRCSGAFCPMAWIPDEEGVRPAGLAEIASGRRAPST